MSRLPTFDELPKLAPLALAAPKLPELPTFDPDPPTRLVDDHHKAARREATDSVVRSKRATTPQAAVEARAVPRASIAELNALDIDQIRERFSKGRYDDRGPVTRFLDLLDLPRNTIAGLLAPSIQKRKQSEGETGTFGRGTVRFSDILDDLGVENRVIRGVAGFVGDVALDPLTYIGPAGWGVKGASAGGKTAQLTKGFAKVADEAIQASKAGREAADPLVRSYLAAHGAKTADEVGTALYGAARTKMNKVLRVVGEDKTFGGPSSLLTDALDDVIHPLTAPADAARIEAAKAIVRQYGRANAPGIRFGTNAAGKFAVERAGNAGTTVRAGTGWAHIPFTDISLSGPAVTNRARLGIAANELARGARTSGELHPDIRAVNDLTQAVNGHVEEMQGLSAKIDALDDEDTALAAGEASGIIPGGTIGRREQIGLEKNLHLMRQKAVRDALVGEDKLGGIVAEMGEKVRSLQANPTTNPADLLYAQRVFDANAANARGLVSDATRIETPKAVKEIWDSTHNEYEREVAASIQKTWGDTEGLPFDPTLARQMAEKEVLPAYRARLAARADERTARIFDMSEDSLKALGNYSDAFHAKMESAVQLAKATQGPLDATLTAKDRAIADAAKMALGIDPDKMGHTMFAPLRAVAQSLSDDREGFLAALGKHVDTGLMDADAALRKGFGRHGGQVHETIANYLRASSPVSNPALTQTMNEYTQGLNTILRDGKHALSPDERVIADQLVGAMIDELDHMPRPGDAVHRIIKDAKDSGLFHAHPTLYDELKPFAQQWRQKIKELGELEVSQNRLGATRDAYGLPSLLNRETAARIAKQKRFSGMFKGGSGAGSAGGEIVESFQKPRSTDTFEWVSKGPDGEDVTHSIMEGERIFTRFDDKTLQAMGDPAFASMVQKIKDDFAALEKLQRETPSLAPVAVPASRAQVNKWATKDGRFKWLLGGDITPGSNFFETSASQAIANRVGSSHRNYLGDRLNELAAMHGRDVGNLKIRDWQTMGNGAEVTLDNGAKAKLFKRANGQMMLAIGDQRFRQLDNTVAMSAKWDATQAVLGNTDAHTKWFPEPIADMIERVHEPFKSEESVKGIIKAVDSLNSIWKSVTLAHPSWTLTDLVGSVMLATHAGVTPAELVKNAKASLRIVMAKARGDEEALKNLKLELGGRTLTGHDVAYGPHAAAYSGHGNYGESVGQMMANGQLIPTATHKLWKNPGKAIGEDWDRAAGFADAEMMGKEWSKNPGLKKAGQVKAFVKEGLMRHVVAPWFELNGATNDWVRTNAYLSMLDKGYDAESAAARVSEYMFDMTTMTGTEKKLRRFLPFMSWMKASGVYGLKRLMDEPALFRIAPNVKHALEEASAGNEDLPEFARPSWQREQQAVMWGSGDDRTAFLLGTLAPTEAATHFAAGLGSPILGSAALMDFLGYFTNSLSPVVKAPIELGARREFFTKRSIEPGSAGDLSPTEYLLSQIRPAKELGIGSVRNGPISEAFGRSPAQGVSRLLLGGRIQPADTARLAFNNEREMKEIESAIRKRIARAESANNAEASLASRVELLKLYQLAAQKGVPVPKWAQKQVGELSVQP